jgi:hypothetical protein
VQWRRTRWWLDSSVTNTLRVGDIWRSFGCVVWLVLPCLLQVFFRLCFVLTGFALAPGCCCVCVFFFSSSSSPSCSPFHCTTEHAHFNKFAEAEETLAVGVVTDSALFGDVVAPAVKVFRSFADAALINTVNEEIASVVFSHSLPDVVGLLLRGDFLVSLLEFPHKRDKRTYTQIHTYTHIHLHTIHFPSCPAPYLPPLYVGRIGPERVQPIHCSAAAFRPVRPSVRPREQGRDRR